MTWLLYGATGYTGRLIARRAAAEGLRPVLAGRNAAKLVPLAAELSLEHRVFGLGEPAAIRRGLDGVTAVAHCAGPFARTAVPMATACIETGTAYLDITGEIDVFEALHRLGPRARAAGVTLLPGAGFDVVPTDCVAALLAARLPDATQLDLAFLAGGGPSPGSVRTALEGASDGGRIRAGVRSVPSPSVRGRCGPPSRPVPARWCRCRGVTSAPPTTRRASPTSPRTPRCRVRRSRSPGRCGSARCGGGVRCGGAAGARARGAQSRRLPQ